METRRSGLDRAASSVSGAEAAPLPTAAAADVPAAVPRSVATVRDYAVMLLDVDGRVVGWNAGAERITGYPAAEITGRSLATFYPAEEVRAGAPDQHLSLAAAVGHAEYEGWRLRRDGTRFWADVVLASVVDERGVLCGYGKVTRDATERRNAELAVRDREVHCSDLKAMLRDYAILMLDVDGRVISWNAGAERIKGYRASEILGRSFAAFYPPEELERDAPARHLAEALAAGHVEHEGWRVRRDGSRFWANVVITAVFDDQGALHGYGKVTYDASERRAAGRGAWDADADQLSVASARDYAVVLLDPAGIVVGWNAGAERIKGYRAEEITGRSFEAFYPPEEVDLGAPGRHLAEAAASGHAEYEGWRVRRDGSRFWADVILTAVLDEHGVQGFGKVTRDATERHTAEQTLRDSKDHFRLLVASVRDDAILMLDPAGRVTSWNAGAERIKGYRAAEIIGRSFATFYPKVEQQQGEPARHLAEAQAVGHVEYEGRRVRQDGSTFWANVVLTSIVDDDGGLRGYGKVTRDATDRRNAEQALREREEHFGLLVASVRDYAILTLDTAGRVTSWNAGAERLKGYRAEEIVGRSFATFYTADDVARGLPARHLARAATVGHVEYEGWRVRQDGSRFWADVVLTAMVDDEGELRGYGKVTKDATERKRFEGELADRVRQDPLTGLGNRTLLMERLGQARTRMARRGGILTLLFLDLDRFKVVNDTLGHEVGDELLVLAGGLLRGVLRQEDTAVRFGGDEFVVLCGDLGEREVESFARRVTDALNVPVTLSGREVFLSVSVGVVTDAGQRTPLELLRDADAAMYRAKGQGGGRHVRLDSVASATSDQLELSSELHRALEREELRAWYQPLYDLHTGEVLAFEALVRWRHPERGLLAPADFLGLAEELGLIVDFDAWMLRTACVEAGALGRRLARPVGAWVNLSGRILADRALRGSVRTALDQSGLDPALLTLEITEGALMRDAAATVRTLSDLCELGVQLAIDDFGTGYSSLAYLQRFPVHVLKVDRSFVEGLDGEGGDDSTAIVRAVVSLAVALGMRTVAEGIETAEQLKVVTGLGCDLGQGYLLGRPCAGVPPPEGPAPQAGR